MEKVHVVRQAEKRDGVPSAASLRCCAPCRARCTRRSCCGASLAALGLVCGVTYGVVYALWDWGPSAYSAPPSVTQRNLFVTPAELEALRDDSEQHVVLLDARSSTDGLVPGAVHAPWKHFARGGGSIRRADYGSAAAAGGGANDMLPTGLLLEAAELQARLRALGLRENSTAIVYGAWHRVTYKVTFTPTTWGEEGRLFWMLHYLNVSDVRCLYGGVNAWRKEGRALVSSAEAKAALAQRLSRTPPSASGAPFVAQPVGGRRATASSIQLGATVLLDARASREFYAAPGDTSYGAVRGGHISGAGNFYWEDVFANGNLRAQVDLREQLGALGVRFISSNSSSGSGGVVTYCTGGIRSGFLYMVLVWLGAAEPQNYDGSWWEWSVLHSG